MPRERLIKIAVSVLSADFGRLGEQVAEAADTGHGHGIAHIIGSYQTGHAISDGITLAATPCPLSLPLSRSTQPYVECSRAGKIYRTEIVLAASVPTAIIFLALGRSSLGDLTSSFRRLPQFRAPKP